MGYLAQHIFGRGSAVKHINVVVHDTETFEMRPTAPQYLDVQYDISGEESVKG